MFSSPLPSRRCSGSRGCRVGSRRADKTLLRPHQVSMGGSCLWLSCRNVTYQLLLPQQKLLGPIEASGVSARRQLCLVLGQPSALGTLNMQGLKSCADVSAGKHLWYPGHQSRGTQAEDQLLLLCHRQKTLKPGPRELVLCGEIFSALDFSWRFIN